MRRLIITENELGPVKQYVVESSAGVRATASTLEGALIKMLGPQKPAITDEGWSGISSVFKTIRPTGGKSQIHEGVQS